MLCVCGFWDDRDTVVQCPCEQYLSRGDVVPVCYILQGLDVGAMLKQLALPETRVCLDVNAVLETVSSQLLLLQLGVHLHLVEHRNHATSVHQVFQVSQLKVAHANGSKLPLSVEIL